MSISHRTGDPSSDIGMLLSISQGYAACPSQPSQLQLGNICLCVLGSIRRRLDPNGTHSSAAANSVSGRPASNLPPNVDLMALNAPLTARSASAAYVRFLAV